MAFRWHFPGLGGQPPSPRHGSSAVLWKQGKVIVFGGWTRGINNGDVSEQYYNDVWLLDLRDTQNGASPDGIWKRCLTIGKPPTPRSSCASAIYGNKMYIHGGGQLWNGKAPKTMEWREVTPKGEGPTPREGHSMLEYDGALYLFGGTDSVSNYHNMYKYDIDQNEWSFVPQRGDIPQGRGYFPWVRHGSHAWCIYGSAWHGYLGEISDDILSFDFETLTWVRLDLSMAGGLGWMSHQNIPSPRFAHVAACIGDHILLYGGWNIVESVPVYYDDLYCFDTVTRRWSRIPPSNSSTKGPGSLYSSGCVAASNDLILIGGHNGLTSSNVVAILKTLGGDIIKPARNRLMADWKGLLFNDKTIASFSDFSLVCSDGVALPAHKVVLAARSEKFRCGIFRPDFIDSRADSFTINANSTVVKLFLEYMYSASFPADSALEDSDVVFALLQLADEYLLADLKQDLEYFLQFSIQKDNVLVLYENACRCNSTQLKQLCMDFIAFNRESLSTTVRPEDLADDIRAEVEQALQPQRTMAIRVRFSVNESRPLAINNATAIVNVLDSSSEEEPDIVETAPRPLSRRKKRKRKEPVPVRANTDLDENYDDSDSSDDDYD